MPTQITLIGISEAFDGADIECLVRTAAVVVSGDLDNLSALQRELAERAYRLVQAEDTDHPAGSVDDDRAAAAAMYSLGSTADSDTVRLRETETHIDNEAASGDATDPVVRVFLDLSTAHLAEETCRDLNNYDGVTAYETAYGWLMHVSADADERAADGDWPSELLAIVHLARIHGCDYILFDRDAPQTEQLPIFDW